MNKTDNPSIFILGAGALGSFFGCVFSEKFDVTLVARQKYITQIKKSGLRLTGLKDRIYYLKCISLITQLPTNSLIFITTKAQDLKSAVLAIKKKLNKDTILVVLQNGLGQENEVKKLIPNRVIRLVTEQGSRFTNQATVVAKGPFPTYIQKGNEDIVSIFENAGLPITEVSDIRQKTWEKLMINCVVNGLATILRVPNNELGNKILTPIKERIKDECFKVAEKDGFTLNKGSFREVEKLISKSENINSTLQDIQKGKQTEIDYLNGMVVKLGKEYNIETPVNEMIWRMIKYMEKNN